MLAYLEGIVKDRAHGDMIVVVGSESQGWVGYQVKTPDHPRYEVYIPGQRAEVYLYTNVREDALDLYGFLSPSEKNLFTTFLSVSGVGPRMALGLLSHTDEANLIEMILTEDKAGLTAISGVGKKTAERMILELKDPVKKKMDAGLFKGKVLSGASTKGATDAKGASIDRTSKLFIEAYLALQGLGYKDLQAKEMIETALKKQAHLSKVEDVIKTALQGNF
ncbi:MAG: Holliday junction branch migration protein RuvA [Bdellovibrionales bacterium]|nr:Holliday junction branch migration protein RuvA [Oligoflexia bacterium]